MPMTAIGLLLVDARPAEPEEGPASLPCEDHLLIGQVRTRMRRVEELLRGRVDLRPSSHTLLLAQKRISTNLATNRRHRPMSNWEVLRGTRLGDEASALAVKVVHLLLLQLVISIDWVDCGNAFGLPKTDRIARLLTGPLVSDAIRLLRTIIPVSSRSLDMSHLWLRREYHLLALN